jgi:glutaminyl-peptide cyclotransferase
VDIGGCASAFVFSGPLQHNARMTRLILVRGLKTLSFALFLASSPGFSSCGGSSTANSSNRANAGVPTYGYEIVNTYSHARDSFTQGLEYHNGKLFESAGGEGSSSLRLVELGTGKVLDKVDVPMPYFAEGLTLLNGKLHQLTWQNQVGFIYDANSLSKIGQFNYDGEGWGLTNDGTSLILSDGSNRIRFLDPGSFKVTRTIAVVDGNKPVDSLNELEYINGEIYANIWHRDLVAIINPQTGKVNAWLNLSGLLKPNDVQDQEAVLNGIAFDAASNRLFVTGKLWPKLFEIRVKR